jgi:hypothetical protein
MAPANGGLVLDKFVVGMGVIEELTCWGDGGVKVGVEAGDEHVDQIGVQFASFGMLMGRR